MAHSTATSNPRSRPGHAERTAFKKRVGKSFGDLDGKYFDFDRKLVARVLDTLRGAMDEGAAQMEMVADERMFEKSLSGTFSRTALHLDRMARRLGKLLDDVGSATGYPKIGANFPLMHAVVRRLPIRPA
jgi:hypothetical protein